jgi:hypothetical protein
MKKMLFSYSEHLSLKEKIGRRDQILKEIRREFGHRDLRK